jgi:hypothetical protein
MNIKLGQLRRWKDGAFKDGIFLVVGAGPYASYLIEEYGVIRGISRAAIEASELLSDVEI